MTIPSVLPGNEVWETKSLCALKIQVRTLLNGIRDSLPSSGHRTYAQCCLTRTHVNSDSSDGYALTE